MKIKITLTLESSLVEKARKILYSPPAKSLSAFVDEALYNLINQNKEKQPCTNKNLPNR